MTPPDVQFLEFKYPNAKGYISVWNKQTRLTEYFSGGSLDALIHFLEKQFVRFDVYVALGTQRTVLKPIQRGSGSSVVELPGFVLDIDLALEKDGQKKYPPDVQTALAVLADLPLRPTAIIHTGGGLHIHYDLDALLVIDSPEQLSIAKRIWTAFQRMAQKTFKQHGFEIDSVGDLTRNYRIPGTLNHKYSPPRTVKLLEFHPDRRYALSYIQQLIDDHEGAEARKSSANSSLPLGDHDEVAKECLFYRSVVEDAATTNEPAWHAGASITARCVGGRERFHEYSRKHESYSFEEAERKFDRALKEAGPRTCEAIERDLGFDCSVCVHRGQITSPIQLGHKRLRYEPGAIGPQPLGFTKEGLYAFRDPVRNLVILASASQLLAPQYLIGLAPSWFWARQFPSAKPMFDFMRAGETLISLCRKAGPFNPARARGRGIWLEDGNVIVNLGGPIPAGVKNLYLCFEPIPLSALAEFPTSRLLDLIKLFRWRDPKDAMLFLGWLAIAAVCGVLQWRPHIYVYGPPKCGKTTIHTLTARLLYPLVISTDGQSSEAGIRQTLGPDSLAILIDEFESDHSPAQLRGVIRLARSASSAENPVLRGSPEGRAMQFSLRATFFFSGVNPIGMSPADESRIVLLEMLMHGNDTDIAKRIIEEEVFFKTLGPAWCGYMVSHATLIPAATDVIERALPSLDRRHRQNMATLLSGYFVALHGRIPTGDEAKLLAAEFEATVEMHAEALDRDDAKEALDYLFAHVVEGYPLGHWAATHYMAPDPAGNSHHFSAKRIMQTFDIVFDLKSEPICFYLRNGSPAIDKVFMNTKWADRAWMRAVKKLPEAFSPRNPIYFGGTGGKCRATGIPVSYLPDPLEVPSDNPSY